MEGTEQRSSIGFLDIPLEIRQQICHSCLVRRSVIVVDYLHGDPDQFESLRFEKLLLEDFGSGDFSSVIDEEVPEKSAYEGHETFEVEVADVDNEDDSVPSEFDWWKVRYFSSVEPKTNSLVLVCKKVSQEATDVLYGCNTFRCIIHGDGGYCLKKHFSEANRRKIRKLEVVLRPMGCFYAPGKMLDSGLWSPILEGLTHFSIVAQQPLSPGTYWFGGSFEEDMRRWIDWAGPMLEFLASRLSGDCQIYIDDDEKEETSALVKQCFSRGYQKVRTRHGDFCFYRGYYALESEYWQDDGYMGGEWSSSD
jgi:hypothetical protein